MIDNFELIKKLFYFSEGNNLFFHCQIVRRVKDYKDKGERPKENPISTYIIKSKEHLEKIEEEIKLLCEHRGARAYINVSGKDFSTMQTLMLSRIAEDVHLGIVRNPTKYVNSTAGILKSRDARWIVDIDDCSQLSSIKKEILKLYCIRYDKDCNSDKDLEEMERLYILAEIPTRNGIHLIVKPFHLQLFKDVFPNVDVHKNSAGTLLYFPSSLDRHQFCCSECGGTNIQVKAWVDPNTNEYISDIEDDGECWCSDCLSNTIMK